MKTKITNEQKNIIINGIKKYDNEYFKNDNYGNSCIMDDDENMFCFIDCNGYIFIDVKNNLIGFGWEFEKAIKNGLKKESLEYLIEWTSL